MQTIITIGSGYSGSSAVYELLQLTNNFHDPFPNIEFSVTYDPGGLIDIENIIRENFTINKTQVVVNQFKKNIIFYTNKSNGLKPGKNISVRIKDIKNIFENYITSLVELNYNGETIFINHNNSIIKNFYKKINFKLKNNIQEKMFLLCNINSFSEKTDKFFKDLFEYDNDTNKDILLDQAGTVWRPHSSTKYFNNPICIITLRDPRDIFSEFRAKAAFAYPGYDVNIFIEWYKKIMGKINNEEYKLKNILNIKFEDFILNSKKISEKISDHISHNIDLDKTNFDYSKSKKNIQRYKDNLEINEINIIENKLKEFLNY